MLLTMPRVGSRAPCRTLPPAWLSSASGLRLGFPATSTERAGPRAGTDLPAALAMEPDRIGRVVFPLALSRSRHHAHGAPAAALPRRPSARAADGPPTTIRSPSAATLRRTYELLGVDSVFSRVMPQRPPLVREARHAVHGLARRVAEPPWLPGCRRTAPTVRGALIQARGSRRQAGPRARHHRPARCGCASPRSSTTTLWSKPCCGATWAPAATEALARQPRCEPWSGGRRAPSRLPR